MTKTENHSLIEDAQGIAYGAGMAAFSVTILTHLGLITGQTAGLAVLLSYATGYSFGLVFFVINIPFYWIGYKRIGTRFVIKTFIAVALVSTLTELMPGWIQFDALNPVVGMILFGAVTGSALIALFRHGASLGGIGIIGLILQDRFGFRAGHFQLLFDVCLFLVAFSVLDLREIALSFLGALVANLTIAVNHRRDRYIAT